MGWPLRGHNASEGRKTASRDQTNKLAGVHFEGFLIELSLLKIPPQLKLIPALYLARELF
jgi:hypothetical protein